LNLSCVGGQSIDLPFDRRHIGIQPLHWKIDFLVRLLYIHHQLLKADP
jgi:hypothetical protein